MKANAECLSIKYKVHSAIFEKVVILEVFLGPVRPLLGSELIWHHFKTKHDGASPIPHIISSLTIKRSYNDNNSIACVIPSLTCEFDGVGEGEHAAAGHHSGDEDGGHHRAEALLLLRAAAGDILQAAAR